MPCSRTQHGLTRMGLEPPTSGSGVRGINHQAIALPRMYERAGFLLSFSLFPLPLGAKINLSFLIDATPGLSLELFGMSKQIRHKPPAQPQGSARSQVLLDFLASDQMTKYDRVIRECISLNCTHKAMSLYDRTITKTRPCNILQFFTAVKNGNFQMKNCNIFLFSF